MTRNSRSRSTGGRCNDGGCVGGRQLELVGKGCDSGCTFGSSAEEEIAAVLRWFWD